MATEAHTVTQTQPSDGVGDLGTNWSAVEKKPWYANPVQNVDPVARAVFERYSGVPSGDVVSHVNEIREKAWKVFRYPCIGEFRFLEFGLAIQPYYPTVLERVKQGQTLLDIGCCFGQDLRKLVFDGAPSDNLFGTDLNDEFIGLGFDLFRDRDKFPSSHLFTSNILAEKFPSSAELSKLAGKVDIIVANALLHLFSYEEQLLVCHRVIELLSPKPGSLFIGRMVGNLKGRKLFKHNEEGEMFRHDKETFHRMWSEAAKGTMSKWKIEGEVVQEHSRSFNIENANQVSDGVGMMKQHKDWAEEGARGMWFAVWRE